MVNFEKFMLCQEVTDPCNEIPTVPPPPEPDGEDDNTGGGNNGSNTPVDRPPNVPPIGITSVDEESNETNSSDAEQSTENTIE